MKRYSSHTLVLITLLIISTSSHCYAATSYESQTEMYFRAIWGLAVVVGIMLIIFALVRKRFSLVHNNNENKIKVVEMRPLMPKKSLCLVEVEGKQILLGISADKISFLSNVVKDDKKSFSTHLSTAGKE